MQGALPGRCAQLLISHSAWKPTPTTSSLPQTTTPASIRNRGDGSSLAHIWQETLCSKGKASVWSDLTSNFCRAGQGDTHPRLHFRSAWTHTEGGTCLSLETDTLGTPKHHKGPSSGSETELSTETQTHVKNASFQSQNLQRSEMPALGFHIQKGTATDLCCRK